VEFDDLHTMTGQTTCLPIKKHTSKHTKKVFFTSWIFQSWTVLCCACKWLHGNFRHPLVGDLTKEGKRVPHPKTRKQVSFLNVW